MLESGVIKAYSASVQARIFVTVVVVPVVSLAIHVVGALAQSYQLAVLVSICPVVHPLGTAFIAMFQFPNRLVEFTVFMLVPLTNVGCTATFPLHSKLVEFTVFMLVHDTNVACTVTAHVLPFTLVTGAVYVTAQWLQLKLVTQVELVRYHASFVRSLTLVGKIELSTLIIVAGSNVTSGHAVNVQDFWFSKKTQLAKSYNPIASSLSLTQGTQSKTTLSQLYILILFILNLLPTLDRV